MEPSIYSYSLCIALPLMSFFGFYFLLASTPEKAIFNNYLRSRRIMGVAILLLAANYSVHFFFGIRFKNTDAAILMNLATYFLCYWLFSSALTTLLDRFYITRNVGLRTHIMSMDHCFPSFPASFCCCYPNGMVYRQRRCLLALAAWLVIYGLVLTRRVILRAYHRVIRIFDDTRADDIGAYIKWLSIFTYWAIIFGVGCGLLTFLPDEYIYIWILSSVPFYIYLFLCYLNYLLFYEQVENAMEDGMTSEEEDLCDTHKPGTGTEAGYPSFHAEIAKKIKGWIDADGYIRPGLTIKELSDVLHTNRTYLSGYIKTTYDMSFRDWITGLRIRICETSACAISEVDDSRHLREIRFFVTKPFYKAVQGKCRLYPC